MKKIFLSTLIIIIMFSIIIYYNLHFSKNIVSIGPMYDLSRNNNTTYMDDSKSLLIKIDKQGEILNIINYDQDYSWAEITPDGNNLLCKVNYFSMDWKSDYVIIDLITGEQYKSPVTQYYEQDHIILTNNMIGIAWSDIVKLYDMQYNPINIKLYHDLGKKLNINEESFVYENFITGIEFDEKNQNFIISWSQNTNNDEYFSTNQLGISIFNYEGKLVAKQILPDKYMSPYSINTRYIMPNRIVLLNNNWLLLNAMDKNYRTFMLMMNIENGQIQELSYGLGGRVFINDNNIYTSSGEKLDRNSSTLLINIDDSRTKILREFPNQLVITTNNNPQKSEIFHPYDAVLNNERGYIAASNEESLYFDTTGLFYWEDNHYTLIRQLPQSGYFNLINMDAEGNCLLLVW